MSRFDDLRARFDGAVATLVQAKSDPEPEGYSVASTEVRSLDSDISWPEDEVEDYWRLYETNPLISGPIDQLATEVFEPGYWVEAASSDTEDELTEFLENMGIEAGMPKRDFSNVGEQAVIQYEVRGTYTAEKVTEDGKHIAVNPIKSNTLKIHTKPDTNILVAPNDHRSGGGNLKLDEEGKAAAFVQFDNQDVRFHNRRERRFQRDQVLFWPRNPDIGDVRGTSRLEQIYERARALQAKLRDNDDAIAMKAWPMILFKLGSEDRPWTKDQMTTFMDRYKEGNLGPGMYHGVPGDVDIDEFAGETADISEAVQTDVDMVISGMPGPRYALGGFEQNVSTTVAAAQERQYRKYVRNTRRALEDLFTPYLVDVAESWDLDSEDIQLHIGRPDGEVAPEDISGSIIRYTSDANDGKGENDTRPIQEPTGGSSNDSNVAPGTPTDETGADDPSSVSAGSASDGATEASEGMPNAVEAPVDVPELDGSAELADPRLVATQAEKSGLAEAIESVLIQTRDRALDELFELFRNGQSPRTREIEAVLNNAYNETQHAVDLDRVAEDELQSVAEKTTQTLSQQTHSPTIDSVFGPTQRQLSSSEATELVRDTEDVRDDMVAQFDAIVGSAQTGSLERLRERLRGALDDDTLAERARLVAHMHAQQLVNSIKLSAYQDHADIVGIEVTNACGPNTTPLCRDLAGCSGEEPARAFFEEAGTLGAQLESQTSEDLFDGFDPLPALPPWHHNCRSEIVPVTESPA